MHEFELAATRFLAVRDLSALRGLLNGLQIAIESKEKSAKIELDCLAGLVKNCRGDRQFIQLVDEAFLAISLQVCKKHQFVRADVVQLLRIQVGRLGEALQENYDEFFFESATSSIVAAINELEATGRRVDLSECWQELELVLSNRSSGEALSWDHMVRSIVSISGTKGVMESGTTTLLRVWKRIFPAINERGIILRRTTCSRVAKAIVAVYEANPHEYEQFCAVVLGLHASNLNRISIEAGTLLAGDSRSSSVLLYFANMAKRGHKVEAEVVFMVAYLKNVLIDDQINELNLSHFDYLGHLSRLLRVATTVPCEFWHGGQEELNPNRRITQLIQNAYNIVR